jgi:hypothetical protein
MDERFTDPALRIRDLALVSVYPCESLENPT